MSAPDITGSPLPYPAAWRQWWMVTLLFVVSIFSLVDRSIFGLVVDPIRRDLAISDVQVSLLQGLAFGIFYAGAGLFLGFAADRLPRRRLLMAGLAVWSVATMMCGLAESFTSLFIWRMVVGAGEAVLIPVGVSMIADLFPADRRGRPLGLFTFGQTLSIGLAIAITGLIMDAVPAGRFAAIPGLSDLSPWRATFVICGAGGMLVVPLLLTATEPVRRTIAPTGSGAAAAAHHFVRYWRLLLPFYLGFAFAFVAVYGIGAWAPSLLTRRFGLGPGDVGRLLGPATIAAAAVSTVCGGLLVDFIVRRGWRGGKLLMLSLAALFALPCGFAVLAPGVSSAVVLLGWMMLAQPAITIAFTAVVQDIFPGDMRGLGIAIALLTNTLIASSAGTYLVAAVNQYGFRDPAMIGWSIAIVLVPSLVLSSLMFLTAFIVHQRSSTIFNGVHID